MTGKLTAPQDQAEKELSRLRKRMSTDKINVTVTNESSRENPIFDLKGILSLPDLLPGALKIAYLTAFKTLGDAFLDDALKSSVARRHQGNDNGRIDHCIRSPGNRQVPEVLPLYDL